MTSKDADTMASTNFSDLKPLEEFTLFPKLATEIRPMIWGHALPGPRVVTISQKFDGPCGSYGLVYNLGSEQLTPAMLRVNSEARAVALEHYKPSFYGVNGRPQLFDHSKDILNIQTSPSVLWNFRPELRDEVMPVHNLAYSGHPRYMRGDRDHHKLLEPFHNLHIYFVRGESVRVKEVGTEVGPLLI
jgi:2EXR family